MIRRFLSPIAARLLLFNVLLVFLPVAGLFSLRAFEKELLDLQERAMVQQGRLVAAALSEHAVLDPGEARALIQRLRNRSETRIRVVDRNGSVIADSAGARPAPIETEQVAGPPAPASRNSVLYRIGVTLWRAFDAVNAFFGGSATPRSYDRAPHPTARDVVQKALGGRYAATVTVSRGQRSLTLYVALPIRGEGGSDVGGAVLVSQSTSRILRALWRVRLDTFEVFALSVAFAIVLSLLVSATIARPLIRLRNQADELLDHRGRLRKRFEGSRRADEIGDLTRALEQLTTRLERHLVFVESFAADMSHEFKNPLASIRNAAELLPHSSDQEEREQLGNTIEKEVARLTRLLGGVRELSKVDAAVDMEAAVPVDVRSVLAELARGHERVRVSVPAEPLLVTASIDRLRQAFGNILDNALSFSPTDGRVSIAVSEQNGFARIHVEDEGPGIPPEHLERVFERFFSFRPEARGDHDGLGLAIARAVIEGYGGTIRASNLPSRGARIEVSLPTAKA